MVVLFRIDARHRRHPKASPKEKPRVNRLEGIHMYLKANPWPRSFAITGISSIPQGERPNLGLATVLGLRASEQPWLPAGLPEHMSLDSKLGRQTVELHILGGVGHGVNGRWQPASLCCHSACWLGSYTFITGAGAALHGDNMQSVSERQRLSRHSLPHEPITWPAC